MYISEHLVQTRLMMIPKRVKVSLAFTVVTTLGVALTTKFRLV
jgi:hypothetical protein